MISSILCYYYILFSEGHKKLKKINLSKNLDDFVRGSEHIVDCVQLNDAVLDHQGDLPEETIRDLITAL